MKKTAHDYFLAVFRRLIDEAGRGAQRDLARKIGKSTTHINDVLKGRKKASQEMQEEISSYFSLNFEEILARGRSLLEHGDNGKTYFPHSGKVEHLPANSQARAALIYKLTAADHGITGLHWFTEDAIKHARPPGVEAYLNEEIDDAALYEEAEKEMLRLVSLVEARLEQRKKLKI